MYDTVLIALDGSPASTTAIPHAQMLAGDRGRIVAIHVRELVPGRSSQVTVPAPEAERAVREWVERVRHEGANVELRVETTASGAAEAIANAAREEHADVIVLGTRRARCWWCRQPRRRRADHRRPAHRARAAGRTAARRRGIPRPDAGRVGRHGAGGGRRGARVE